MKKQILGTLALALLGNISFAQKKLPVTADGFTVLPSGLEYKYIKDVPGKTYKIGDQMSMHFKSQVRDSVLFDSKEMMKGEPVLFALQEPRFHADVNEGLLMLTKGDIIVFRTPLDSIVASGDHLFPWMDHNDKMVYNVEVLDLKTAEQVNKENEEKQSKMIAGEEKELSDYFKVNKLTPQKTASGLYYTITQKGAGENAKAGQNVTVNYRGKLLNGKVFDSNMDSAFHHVQPFTFPLGQGRVIKGWDEGIALFNKGAKGTLFIPSRYAYGPQSPSPDIPANSILVFDVELLDMTGTPSATPPADGHDHSHDGHQH